MHSSPLSLIKHSLMERTDLGLCCVCPSGIPRWGCLRGWGVRGSWQAGRKWVPERSGEADRMFKFVITLRLVPELGAPGLEAFHLTPASTLGELSPLCTFRKTGKSGTVGAILTWEWKETISSCFVLDQTLSCLVKC